VFGPAITGSIVDIQQILLVVIAIFLLLVAFWIFGFAGFDFSATILGVIGLAFLIRRVIFFGFVLYTHTAHA